MRSEDRDIPPQAMVLAAGLGTRLWPLTADRAKPAVPFAGVPLVRRVVEWVQRHGVGDVAVNTHYQAESVRAALEGLPGVSFSHETEILGTAGCLAQARRLGCIDPNRPTLIANGKLVTNIDLTAALAAHRASGAAITMVLRSNPSREAFREVLVRDGRIAGFGEGRQPTGPDPLLFTGIHVVEPEVLATIEDGPSDTIRDVYPPYIEAGRVHGHLADEGRWWELSTLERYADLHIQGAREGLNPEVVCGSGASIHPTAAVRRSVLWSGASVGRGCTLDRVVLGADVALPRETHLENTVVVRRDRVLEIERGEVHDGLVLVPLA